jgi:tetratricopeptide (TPR) repeat protein
MLASLCKKHQRTEEAIAVYQQGMKELPKDTYLRTLLARTYEEQQKWQEARQVYGEMLSITPTEPGAYSGLLRALTQLKQEEQFPALVTPYVERDASNEAAIRALVSFYRDRGKAAEGVSVLASLAQKHAKQKGVWLALAQLQQEAGQEEDALKSYEQVLQIDGADLQALRNIAQIHEKRNEPLKAADIYERILAGYPQDIPTRLRLAGMYEQAGQKQKAIEQYREVLKRDANNTIAKESLQRLGESSSGG